MLAFSAENSARNVANSARTTFTIARNSTVGVTGRTRRVSRSESWKARRGDCIWSRREISGPSRPFSRRCPLSLGLTCVASGNAWSVLHLWKSEWIDQIYWDEKIISFASSFKGIFTSAKNAIFLCATKSAESNAKFTGSNALWLQTRGRWEQDKIFGF